MRRYSETDERRVRAQAHVREWKRAGFIDAMQAQRLDAELGVDLKRTNVFLRATAALFTALIVGAVVGFVFSAFDLTTEMVIAVAALVCIATAELLVGVFRLYRFGIEEMLAACAAVLLSISAAQFWTSPHAAFIAGLFVAAAAGCVIYSRFGFVWAAIGSMCCAAAIPFQLINVATAGQRSMSAVILGLVFAVVRPKRLRDGEEWPGDEYGVLQAAALGGIYLVLNLRLIPDMPLAFGDRTDGVFYWWTWVMTWVLPAAGLVLSIRAKDRPLIVVSLAMAIVTLVTNKPYLGWTRYTWDPMLLGIVLMAGAVVLRRWLSSGPTGARYGFTAARVVRGGDSLLTVLSAAPFPVKAHAPAAAPAASGGFDGGRSGGAGAGGSF
jgi:hypothetical protein